MIFVELKTFLANPGSIIFYICYQKCWWENLLSPFCSPWAVLNTFPLALVSSFCQSRVLVPPAKTTICMVLLSFVALMRYIFKEKSWGSLSKCNLHSSPHCLPLLVHVQDHPRVWVTVGSVTTWAGWMNKVYFVVIHDDDHSVIRMIWKIMKITSVQMYVHQLWLMKD